MGRTSTSKLLTCNLEPRIPTNNKLQTGHLGQTQPQPQPLEVHRVPLMAIPSTHIIHLGSVTMNSAQTIILSYTGTLGNTNAGSGSNYQSISNTVRGAPFTASQTGTAQSISAYLNVGSSYRNIQAAIYTTSGTLVGSTSAVTGTEWFTMGNILVRNQTNSHSRHHLCSGRMG